MSADTFSPEEWQAIWLTLKVAILAVLGSLPFAIGIAWLLSYTRFPGKIVLEALISLPLVLPPVVTGYALLVLLGRHGAVGRVLDQDLGIVGVGLYRRFARKGATA